MFSHNKNKKFTLYLSHVGPCHVDSLVSCVQGGVHARAHSHVHVPVPCVTPEGGFPGPGMNSSYSFELCLCPGPGPSPVSLGSDPPDLSRHPQAWPRGAGTCGRAAQLHPWQHGPPGSRVLHGPCYNCGPVDLAEGTVRYCCHLLRSVPVSSCHEALRAQRCVPAPGWQTGTPGADTRRETLSVQDNVTCWK